jgi:hypothetical protein
LRDCRSTPLRERAFEQALRPQQILVSAGKANEERSDA